jgi:hypothetical protein
MAAPISFVDVFVCWVIPNEKYKYSVDYFIFSDHIQDFLPDVLPGSFNGRIGLSPLMGIAVSGHKRSGIGININDRIQILRFCFSDCILHFLPSLAHFTIYYTEKQPYVKENPILKKNSVAFPVKERYNSR